MFNQRKGITPVIAIVLLLLITVGAVAVVYDQFSGLVEGSNAQEEQQQNQRIQQSSYSITGVTQYSNSGSDYYRVRLRNTGDETLDLDQLGTLRIGVDGASPQAVALIREDGSGACSFGTLAPGAGANCDTGVSWGGEDDGQGTSIEFMIQGATKASETCYESNDACSN